MRDVPTSTIPSDFKLNVENETHHFADDLRNVLAPKKRTIEKARVSSVGLHDHDFNTQPTNFELEEQEVVVKKDFERKVQINKAQNTPAEDGIYKMKSQADRDEITVPFALQRYIESLIKSGRALRSFKEFYFDSKKTNSKWKDILARYHDSGGFNNEEYVKALQLLEGEVEVEFVAPIEGKINLKIERNVSSVEENLEKARGKYVKEYIDWKNKNRTKKTKYARTLSSLGVDKQLPANDEPMELTSARGEWLKARAEKSATQVRKIDFLEGEYELLNDLIKSSLPPLERNVFGKSQIGWNKLSPAQKMVLSTSLLTGGVNFGTLGLASVGTFEGFRSPQAKKERFATNPAGRVVDGIFKKGNKEEELNQSVIRINEDRLATRFAAFTKAIEEEKNADKKRILMKAADLVRKAENIVPQISIQPIELSLSSRDFAEGVRYLKERITEQYENGRVPQAIRENIIDKSDVELAREFGFKISGEDIVGTFAGEILSLDEKGNISLLHLDGSKDMIINTLEQIVVKRAPKLEIKEAKVVNPEIVKVSKIDTEEKSEENVPLVFNNMEIAHKQSGILTLDDKFQDGEQFKSARSAFVEAFERDGIEKKVGTTPIAIPFEGGKIYVIAGVGLDGKTIQVLLNGKEIARGKLSPKGPEIKLIEAPGVKSGFFFADTVYERAFKRVKSIIKTLRPVQEEELKTVT